MNDYKNYLDEEEKKLKKDAEKRKEGYALQEGHESRPFWVTKKGEIILEAFNPLYSQAYEFVIAIAQPVSRTEFIHQYLITMTSLLGASAYNLSAEGIVKHLKLFKILSLFGSLVCLSKACIPAEKVKHIDIIVPLTPALS